MVCYENGLWIGDEVPSCSKYYLTNCTITCYKPFIYYMTYSYVRYLFLAYFVFFQTCVSSFYVQNHSKLEFSGCIKFYIIIMALIFLKL